MGWWYVFGSASLTLLMIQILTGIGLALVYVPSADKAYDSLLYLNYEQPLGWFLRALHYYAGSGMVVMVLVHMTQVFLHGAYKYPRELTWVMGVFLLLCTLGMFFTGPGPPLGPGRLLGPGRRRLDGRAGAGRRALGRPPAPGRPGDRRRRSEPVLRPARLRHPRRLAVLPGRPPLAGAQARDQRPARSRPGGRSQDLRRASTKKSSRRRPLPGRRHAEGRLLLRPGGDRRGRPGRRHRAQGTDGPPDPTLAGANPRPEWPFLWLFALLSLSPPGAETFIILVFPVILIVALLLVPFVSNRGERAPSRRPVAVLAVIVIYTVLGVSTYQGVTAPWSPEMTAWSGDPVPENMVKNSTPLQLQGRGRVPEQELPQLPRPGRHRRPTRSRPDDRRHPPDARPAHRPGQQRHAGRRQHAGVRQADQPGRDDRPGRIPGEPAAGGPATGRGVRRADSGKELP